MAESSLVNVGELAKPVTTLIDRVSDGVGGLFRPWQIRRVARAESDATLIRAEVELQITDQHRSAFLRFLEEEAAKQSIMENIVLKAIPHVDPDNAQPEDISDDFIRNFFDKCRTVSDEHMQELWGCILAGEANNPGSFSRKTVNLVADLGKREAEMFVNLCRFVWEIGGNRIPVFVNKEHEVYKQYDIDLLLLQQLGLVTIGGAFFALELGPLPKNVIASYHDTGLNLTLAKGADNRMQVGQVRLTAAGLELSSLCESAEAPGFLEYVYDMWASQSLVPTRKPQPAGADAANQVKDSDPLYTLGGDPVHLDVTDASVQHDKHIY
ncbi:MAG: DUF2806 domain-containing protein [Alphaproteobacteria bacterium]|nr:DUF2806 domain-containing protein [Alphaproteobacteria bacterium]